MLRTPLRVLPILLAVAILWLLEASKLEEPRNVREVQAETVPTRLVVFWIDSLAWRDVEDRGLLPRIMQRAETAGLHGPVRSCADAVSVPCFTAMTTGVDRFSIFSLGRNFGGMDGAIEGSLIQQLQARGKRVGYLGDPIFERAIDGFDWLVIEHDIDDLAYIERGLVALDREKLDALVIHLRETDGISHREGPAHEIYASKMRTLDEAIDQAIAKLRPTDSVLVMGDHGHTEDGRHFAGLHVPTYAIFFGPAFGRALRRPMAITDHAAIWGRVFGLHFGANRWVDDYFAGRPVSTPQELPSLPGTPHAPWWALVVALLGGVGIALSRRLLGVGSGFLGPAIDVWRGIGLTFVFAACSGALWTSVRPFISYWPLPANFALALAIGGLGALATRGLAGSGWRPALLLGAVLFALPTVYKYGSAAAATRMLMVVLGVELVLALRAGQRRQAACCAGALGLAFTVFNPALRNFSVRWFPVYSETLSDVALPVCLGLLALAVWLSRGRDTKSWLAAAVIGIILAPLPDVLHPRVAFGPAVLAFPICLAALRNPRWSLPALALAIPALWFTFDRDAVGLGPILAVLALWTLVPRAIHLESARERSLAVLILIWLSLWASFGCRLSGVQFHYFFEWLPEGADVKDTWALNAVVTVFKYLLPGSLGLVLASRVWREPVAPVLGHAWNFAGLKLGAVVVFLGTFAFASVDAGPFIISDVTQEAAIWILVLLTLIAAPLHARSSEPSEAPEAQPADALSRA